MKIIFKGNEIPKEIIFGYTKIQVRHFIPFQQCFRCFRYNHFAQHCKQNFELCRSCFGRHTAEEQCLRISCPNCKGEHPPTHKDCPAREKAYAIKKLMTIENLSVMEARTRFSSIFSNRFSLLEDKEEEFPALTVTSKTNRNHVDNHQEAVESLYKVMPFSKVVKSNNNRRREEANNRKTWQEYRKVLSDHAVHFTHGNIEADDLTLQSKTHMSSQANFSSESGSQNKAMEVLTGVSMDTASAITNWSNMKSNPELIRRLLIDLRERINKGMNYIDVERINKSIIEDNY
ncbi:uncharacterized protein LOC135955382 [Calliphora vicina]|uniref:uncharacterized protein LOC135955382 n=1 Tax=Calliphora vicina TaxID=7373 RepID=UPI00325AD480